MTFAHAPSRYFPSTTPSFRSLGRLTALGVTSAAVIALAAACTVETTSGPGPVPSATAGAGASWKDAPSGVVAMKQGIATSLPFSLSAAAEVSFDAPEGISVLREKDALSVLANYDVMGTQTFKVKLKTAAGTISQALVTVDVKPFKWAIKKSWVAGEGPAGREHPSMFVDQVNSVTYMLQGSGYKPQYEPLPDSWKFDMKTQSWTAWSPGGDVPVPGLGRRSAGPAKDGTFLLHGGEIKSEVSDGELYRLDLSGGGTFKKLTQVNAPPLRSLHFFGMDAELGKSVMFGGFSYEGQATFSDTWIVTTAGDVATWRKVELPKASSPSGRYGGFYVLDEALHKFFVFSGGQQPKSGNPVNPAADTWAFDLQTETWSLLETTGAAPPGRRNGCWMHDTVHHRMFVFGGTPDGKKSEKGLFVLDLVRGSWSEVPGEVPHSRSSGAGFFDAKTGRVFCGFGNDDAVYLDTNGFGYEE